MTEKKKKQPTHIIKNGSKNLAGIRKLALNALAQDNTKKARKSAKHLSSALYTEYRLKILKNLF